MRRFISALMLLAVLASLCACGNGNAAETTQPQNAFPVPEKLVATAEDRAALEATYAGKTLHYGEMHNHTSAGLKIIVDN